MTKILKFMLVLVMCVAIIAGCSNSEGGSTTGGSDSADGSSSSGGQGDQGDQDGDAGQSSDPVEISFSLWDDNQRPGMEKIAAAFHEKYPNITVVVETTPWGEYWTKLNTAAQSKNLPDVMTLNAPNFDTYASAGMLADLTSVLADNGVDLGDFVAPAVEIYTYEGAVYALPRDWDTVGLWYNKQIFEETGATVPTTWEEMVDVGHQIQEAGSSAYPLIIGYNETYTGTWNLIYQAGGSVIKDDITSGYDQEGNKIALQFVYDLMYKEGVMPAPAELGDAWVPELALNDQAAMIYGGSWLTSYFADNPNMDIAPLPQYEGSDVTALVHSVATAVSAYSDHVDEAQLFAAFLGSDEANNLLATEVDVLPAKLGFDGEFFEKNAAYPRLKEVIDGANQGAPHPHTIITGWDTVDLEVYMKLFNDLVTVDEATAEIVERTNAILEKAK